jgi:hypothetical protein
VSENAQGDQATRRCFREHHNHHPVMVTCDDEFLKVADLGMEPGCYFDEKTRTGNFACWKPNDDGVIGP